MAITVPAVGSEINVALFGKPVVDAINPTVWTPVVYQGTWVDFDTARAVKYRKINEIVYVHGMMKSGTIATNAFLLPVGFRPALQNETFCVISNGVPAQLDFYSNGYCFPVNGSNAWIAVQAWFSTV